MHKPFWLMYSPREYYQFRRQTLVNWLDRHTHITSDGTGRCLYCNRDGDELWWYLPTCRAQNWHIRNMYHQYPPWTGDNPFREKD